ncbi:VWA-like domain-containing protein [Lactiplantibacillus fabifermentans]|uniref:VWA-like domain-containing protein n=2 Tax=Lactiplantibacillus fabifermentans TaxID=483011 RepID=A0A0R2NNG4_9LACO|nr:VWA-like domain-containing protein [Lactiplantibacillus fabifermentans]ETY72922.1 hypothetical protein LFAB_14960 [Lactiplantibacillus fabifermentans T30PCM01]KRO27297.1 hypothetical protein DY78_GL000148 [Lactiplantibacillus fabifermentans DSM 21115]
MLNNAMEYARWRQNMLMVPTPDIESASATMVQRAIIELLAAAPFYGEILTRLPRQSAPAQMTPFALIWVQNRLELRWAAAPLAQTFERFDQLQAGLKHVALHVIWQHPLRYRQQVPTQSKLTTLATDLAVNQYVTGLPPMATSLTTVQPMVTTKLPIKADSQTYLELLKTKSATPPENKGQPQPKNNRNQSKTTSRGSKTLTAQIDGVDGWQAATGQLTNPNLAAARLQQLTHDAWTHTPEAGRGLVAGKVAASLEIKPTTAALNWRRLIVKGLGQMPTGRKASRARFNRRQPARMELPGQISDTRLDVQVYVDNSGSISDATLQYLLGQVATLTQALTATITVNAFDAIVQPGHTYQARLPQQIRFERHGGGGTVFQSIFDDLARRHLTNRTTLALILTDGRGERQVENYGFTNVIWLLAKSTDQLSVQPPIGQVVSLKGSGGDD